MHVTNTSIVKSTFYTLLLMVMAMQAVAQSFVRRQFFDGADTFYNSSSFLVVLDTGTSAVWQVGKPVKTIFNSAATVPRALVTDTAAAYPPNATARAQFGYRKGSSSYPYGIQAIRWKQKLDLDTGLDGAVVEYSLDSGATWKNVFNNPQVYNFYGFQSRNSDTLSDSTFCFSGRDTVWRDIWLCFDYSFIYTHDTVAIRFTLRSDSVNTGKEGWMIDNLFMQPTITHTVKKGPSSGKYLSVYPTPTTGRIHIEAEKRNEFHIIEHMELSTADGRVVQRWGRAPTKYYIDIGAHPSGQYYLTVQTNVAKEIVPVLLQR